MGQKYEKTGKSTKVMPCNFRGMRPCMDALDMANKIPLIDD